jgi:tRNA (cmo5U34)-methyltransferase
MTTDEVWKLSPIVQRFLSYRAALPLAREQISVMLALLGTRPEPVSRFIDLGCGDGILGAAVLGQYPQSHGLLVDFSEPMLVQARENLNTMAASFEFLNLDYGLPDWVNAVRAQGSFDAIVSGYSIHHQPNDRKRALYEEIFGLLAPGGWFVNIEHILSTAQTSIELFEKHYIDARYAIELQNNGSRTRAEIAEEYINRPDKAANILSPVEIQCDWLREIGYKEVDCYFRVYELAVFAGRRPQ